MSYVPLSLPPSLPPSGVRVRVIAKGERVITEGDRVRVNKEIRASPSLPLWGIECESVFYARAFYTYPLRSLHLIYLFTFYTPKG